MAIKNSNIRRSSAHAEISQKYYGGKKQILIDDMGRVMSWRFVKYLVDLQENECLHLATKIKEEHINFKKQIMKAKLAAQIMSQSVADAIEF